MDLGKLKNGYWDYRSCFSENRCKENFTTTESVNKTNVFPVSADIYNVKWN